MAVSRRARRDLDVVVFGATGFVGRLVAEYLAGHAPAKARIGLAGRSFDKLTSLRDSIGPTASGWPLLVADAGETASIEAMAAATRVVATTVGPYARYGSALVEACARVGTDYADLTGEVLFVRESLERYGELAATAGARIVHACGFDSIPSDLGVLLLAEQALADHAGPLEDTRLVVTSLRGGLSGGTFDSMRAQAETLAADRALFKVLGDPYSLSPDRSAEPDLGRQSDVVRIHRDRELGVWVGPFVMASYNTRIVRLSNALQGWAYGPRFRYQEYMSYGRRPSGPLVAGAASAGLAGAVAGMMFSPTRALLDRFLPAPGEGPSEESRRNGHFTIEIRTRTATGARYRCIVAAQVDPGYQATSVMLGEAALCLALDRKQLPDRAGVLTPATAMGDALVKRLRAAGLTFTVERATPRAPR